MGWLDRLFKARKRQAARGFAAAKVSRLTEAWVGQYRTIDDELRGDLDRLRARSRDLANNNDYVKKFLRMVARNIVGPNGFVLQARAMNGPEEPDALANSAIELAWHEWGRRGVCDISGRMSFADLCRALASGVARDGEAIVRVIRGNGARNDFGLALQLLDVNRLDTQKNVARAEGVNRVHMGVEVDEYDRPLAYWLKLDGQSARRVSASDLLHVYLPEHAEQSRGIPWTHSVMLRLHNLKGYEEAAIINARVGAAKMGFFVTPEGTGASLSDTEDEGQFLHSVSAGEFGVLPSGYDFRSFDPDYPHQQFGDFIKANLRGIASGLDVAYNSLANDLEGVNYSSIRAGVIEEREQWMALQAWFIEAFLEPIYRMWIDGALLRQVIIMPNGSPLPNSKAEKFRAHDWQPRRWTWVDPLKDIEAARLAVKSGVASPQQIAAQSGQDVEDVLDAIAAFEALAAAKGVSLVDYETSAQQQGGADEQQQ